MTEIYLHIFARMTDYIATHPCTDTPALSHQSSLLVELCCIGRVNRSGGTRPVGTVRSSSYPILAVRYNHCCLTACCTLGWAVELIGHFKPRMTDIYLHI